MLTVLVLCASYGILLLTVLHGVLGDWSGIASLGNFAAAAFSVPFLSVRAWQLRSARTGDAYSPLMWWSALLFPIVFVGFWLVIAASTL